MKQQKKRTAKKAAKKTRQKQTPLSQARVRRELVAAGVAALKSDGEIARETGIHRQQVNLIKQEPEVQARVSEYLRPHTAKVQSLIKRTLETIEEDLDAPALDMFGKLILDKKGKPRPNRRARSDARRDLIALLKAAEPRAGESGQPLIQYNQLTQYVTQIIQRREEEAITVERIH